MRTEMRRGYSRRISGSMSSMQEEHVDRQPPRNEEEEREQDRLIAEGSTGTPTELPTDAPDPDLADDE